MEEMNDDYLQQMAEQNHLDNGRQGNLTDPGLSIKEQQDLLTYQTLFKQLQREPAAGLPYNFAANLRRTVQHQAERKGNLKFQFLLFFAFGAILVLAFGLLHLVSPAATEELMAIAPRYKWSAGLAILVFWSIQTGSIVLFKENN